MSAPVAPPPPRPSGPPGPPPRPAPTYAAPPPSATSTAAVSGGGGGGATQNPSSEFAAKAAGAGSRSVRCISCNEFFELSQASFHVCKAATEEPEDKACSTGSSGGLFGNSKSVTERHSNPFSALFKKS
jgi:hypothetical protein